jgi:hypothetical protein
METVAFHHEEDNRVNLEVIRLRFFWKKIQLAQGV